jgi:hypothetical protein
LWAQLVQILSEIGSYRNLVLPAFWKQGWASELRS